ncbi:MAG: FAD/FMN-containing dehydrogenase [Deltaproteobacteria bacterium]|nr:FAD/FMN-containing dehydrogenase [Deltaproteobacteria bacterium]
MTNRSPLAFLLGRSSSRWLVVVALAWAVAPASADTFGVGDTLAPITLEDQYGELRQVDSQTRAILFSRDMDGGKFLKSGLAGRTGGDLAARRVAYVADISGMPRLVARLFALPGMRKRGYPMLLDRDGEVTARLPDEPGRATLIRLDALRIIAIDHLDDASAVAAAVEDLPAVAVVVEGVEAAAEEAQAE